MAARLKCFKFIDCLYILPFFTYWYNVVIALKSALLYDNVKKIVITTVVFGATQSLLKLHVYCTHSALAIVADC